MFSTDELRAAHAEFEQYRQFYSEVLLDFEANKLISESFRNRDIASPTFAEDEKSYKILQLQSKK